MYLYHLYAMSALCPRSVEDLEARSLEGKRQLAFSIVLSVLTARRTISVLPKSYTDKRASFTRDRSNSSRRLPLT